MVTNPKGDGTAPGNIMADKERFFTQSIFK